jgi:FKBP-type peptidyl-prolyl cis-trans isomerase
VRRKLLAVLLVPALLALGACGDDDESSDSGPSPEATGIEGVSVGGDFGDQPTFDVDATVTADSTEVETLSEGDGDVVKSGDSVTINYIGVIAGSDQPFDSSWARSQPATFTVESGPSNLLPGLVKAIEGQAVGSRVVAVVPPSEAFGQAGNSAVGIQSDSMLVFVIDIMSKPLAEATGTQQEPPATLPELELDDDGHPSKFVATDQTPKKIEKSTATVLIKGDGPEVEDGQTVSMHYVGQIYPDGKIFDASWPRGEALQTTIGTHSLIPCWDNLIPGQTVGSRVVLECTPDDAYGDQAQRGIPANSTLIFAVDILDASGG